MFCLPYLLMGNELCVEKASMLSMILHDFNSEKGFSVQCSGGQAVFYLVWNFVPNRQVLLL